MLVKATYRRGFTLITKWCGGGNSFLSFRAVVTSVGAGYMYSAY
jgi:hypothetical protein